MKAVAARRLRRGRGGSGLHKPAAEARAGLRCVVLSARGRRQPPRPIPAPPPPHPTPAPPPPLQAFGKSGAYMCILEEQRASRGGGRGRVCGSPAQLCHPAAAAAAGCSGAAAAAQGRGGRPLRRHRAWRFWAGTAPISPPSSTHPAGHDGRRVQAHGGEQRQAAAGQGCARLRSAESSRTPHPPPPSPLTLPRLPRRWQPCRRAAALGGCCPGCPIAPPPPPPQATAAMSCWSAPSGAASASTPLSTAQTRPSACSTRGWAGREEGEEGGLVVGGVIVIDRGAGGVFVRVFFGGGVREILLIMGGPIILPL